MVWTPLKLALAGMTLMSATTMTSATSTAMPECATECLAEYIPSSACHVPTNITCICTNVDLTAQTGACVAESCSVRDALLTKRANDETCGARVRDDSIGLRIITPLFGALAILFFGFRVWARYLTGFEASWHTDDWIMLVTTVASIPLSVVSYLFAVHGLGRDLWHVDFADITLVLQLYYYSEILYLIVIFLTKISILYFYLRIFPDRAFRLRAYILIGLSVASAVPFILITIFQCTPIPGAWLHWDGTYEAECRDVQTQAFGAAIVSIALDVATIALPLTELWKLQLSMRRKIGVILMFATGLFVVVVQALRIFFLLKFRATDNFTRDYVATSVWSNVEVYVGIICACFPQLRILLTRCAPRLFATTAGRSSVSKPGSQGTKIVVTSKIRSQVSQRPKHGDESDFIELRTSVSGNVNAFDSQTNLHKKEEDFPYRS